MSKDNFSFTEKFTVECIGEVEEDVYDLEVEGVHNFFANGILLHNSAFISLEQIVEKFIPNATTEQFEGFADKLCNTKLKDKISEAFEIQRQMHNADKQKLSMKREYICDRVIMVKSKNYALHVLNKEGGVHLATPEIKTKGLDAVRTSTPNICRKKIKECMSLMFTSDEDHVIEYIEKFRAEFSKLSPDEYGLPIGANGFKKYYDERSGQMKKGIPQQLRAAVVFNHLVKEMNLGSKYEMIGEGDKVKIVHLRPQNRTRSNVIAFTDKLPPEFGLHTLIDLETQFDHAFLTPIDRLLKVIGWKKERVDDLTDLFG